MPSLNFSQLESILTETPPNPGFCPLIDELMDRDRDLKTKIRSVGKQEQISLIMSSETEHILDLLKAGKTDEAMNARYRLLSCAEAERQKLAAYEDVTREELAKRCLSLYQDIQDTTKLIIEKYPGEDIPDANYYSPDIAEQMMKDKSAFEIHKINTQLWFIDSLKREALKGDQKALNRLKIIERHGVGCEEQYGLTGFSPTQITSDPVETASAGVNGISHTTKKNTYKSVEDHTWAGNHPLLSAKDEHIFHKAEGTDGSGAFHKRLALAFQHLWQKLRAKFNNSSSNSEEKHFSVV